MKFRKACYSLAEFYVRSVYVNLFGWGEGVKLIKPFKAGTGYNILEPLIYTNSIEKKQP
jgi:hypothetical protein